MLATVPYAVNASQQTDLASGSLLGALRESKRSSGVNSPDSARPAQMIKDFGVTFAQGYVRPSVPSSEIFVL